MNPTGSLTTTSRRSFLRQLGGAVASSGIASLAVSSRVLGANDRIRIGLIGAGSRGKEIFKVAIGCPNVEAVAVADVYTRRLDEARALAPGIKGYRDFRQLLEDKSIDAVLIATPQHQHALNFVPAVQAGKDVYQEKTMAFTPAHAKRMRKALEGSGRVVQVGMQMNSGPGLQKVKEMATADGMGTVTAIQAHHYRNARHGGWQHPPPPDCDAQHIDWATFEGEAPHHPFDAQRYLNWRFFWDYSGGNVFENMVHQIGFWYRALDLSIPRSVTMAGANFLSPNMEVPDTMNVTLDQGGKLLFTWNSMFGNAYYGEGYDYLLGTNGTIMHDESDRVLYFPQGKEAGTGAEEGPNSPAKVQAHLGYRDSTPRHMQNFFDCVRERKEPVCPFELGFRSAIACQMAIASYRQQRTVRWDPATEDIV